MSGSYHLPRSGLPRRRFLAGGAAIGSAAFAASVVGCGDDDSSSTSVPSGGSSTAPRAQAASATAAQQPRQGGTFRLVTSTVGIQDPHFASVPTYVDAWFGDPFLQISNKTREYRGGIIEKWEQPDSATTILHVRPGVKFFNMAPANGRTVEGKDIVYTARSMTGSLYPDAKIPFPRKGLFTNVKEPVLVDPMTVRLETTAPRSDLMLSIAEYRNAVLPEGLREFFGGYDSLFTPKPERLVGTGPFVCKAIDPQGETIWERNPDYWNKPYPYLDRVQYNNIADRLGNITALIAGQNHTLTFTTPPEVDTLKRGLPDVQLINFPLNGFYHIGFNARNKFLADPRVRQALTMMFDKPAFSAIVVGKDFWKYSGPLPWGYNEALGQDELASMPVMRSPTAQDISDARKLIDAAGFSSGFAIGHTSPVDVMGVSAFKQVGEHWKEQVEKNLPGVKVNIDASTYTSMLALIAKPDGWDSYAGGWSQEMTPIQMLQVSYLTKGGRNFTGWGNAQFDKLLDDALAAFDDGKRKGILQDAQRLMLKDVPSFATHQGLTTIALRPEVQNLEIGGVGFMEHWVRYAWLKA
jgi:peptide/nickel transport system substrate-binding protein